MILYIIELHGLGNNRKEIFQTVSELVDGMNTCPGCNRADIYKDLDDGNILYLVEEWRSKKDFDRYRNSASLSVLLGLEALLDGDIDTKHAVKQRYKRIGEEKTHEGKKGDGEPVALGF